MKKLSRLGYEVKILNLKIAHQQELNRLYNSKSEEAVKKAEDFISVKMEDHNELIQKMDKMTLTFPSIKDLGASEDRSNIKYELLKQYIEKKFQEQEEKFNDPILAWKNNYAGRTFMIGILWPLFVGVIVYILNHIIK